MRDSGQTWIGMIPEDWNLSRIGSLYTLRNEKVSDKDYPPLSVTMKGVVPQLETAAKTDDGDNRKLVRIGDFAINSRSDRRGSCGISLYDGSVSLINTVLTPRGKMNPGYYNWLFHTVAFADEFYKWGHGIVDDLWTTRWQEMKRIIVPVPSLDAQRKIADYLDNIVSQIDLIISAAQVSIEEYKEWKTSIIFEATTKGVHSDAKMKDTGIPWIGTVPSHWRVTKTLHCLAMAITDGPHTTPELFDSGIPFISAEAVSCGNGRIDFSHMRGYISQEFYEECCKKYIPQIDDVYMIKSGATTGRVAIVDTDKVFTIWSPLAVFRVNRERILPMFLFYALQSDSYQKQVELGWTYGTQQNIGMRTLEALKICLPPIDEQAEIVSYLEERCGTIDSLIKEKEALISDLESFKRSLVYETVTGKRKVV